MNLTIVLNIKKEYVGSHNKTKLKGLKQKW